MQCWLSLRGFLSLPSLEAGFAATHPQPPGWRPLPPTRRARGWYVAQHPFEFPLRGPRKTLGPASFEAFGPPRRPRQQRWPHVPVGCRPSVAAFSAGVAKDSTHARVLDSSLLLEPRPQELVLKRPSPRDYRALGSENYVPYCSTTQTHGSPFEKLICNTFAKNRRLRVISSSGSPAQSGTVWCLGLCLVFLLRCFAPSRGSLSLK